MYPVENAGELLRKQARGLARSAVAAGRRNVFLLGLTSLLTDISAKRWPAAERGSLVQLASGIVSDR
jgi:hypothetical protein